MCNRSISIAQLFPSWEEMTIPKGFENNDNNGNSFLDVFFLKSNPNYGWISGYGSRVLRTTDMGKTWEGAFVEPTHSLQLESVTFVNENVGYVSGNEIYKSTDGGKTWFNISPKNSQTNLWGNYFINENNGMVLGGFCDEQDFFKTTDGGINWTSFVETRVTGSKLSDILTIVPDGLCYAAGSGWIWRSLDGGKTWAIFSRTQTGISDWQEEMTYNKGTILVPYSKGCEGTISDKFGGMRMSIDEGKTWRLFESSHPMFGAFLLSKTNGWAAGFAQSMYYTCDGGLNWELMNCGIKNSSLDDIWFVNDTIGFVVGEKIYRTKNALDNAKYINHDTTYFCLGDSILIISDTKYKKSKWNICGFSKDITITNSGDYYQINYDSLICDIREIHKFPTKVYDKVSLSIQNIKDPKTNYCVGDTLSIGSSQRYAFYKWSTGDTTQYITVTSTGKYFLNVMDYKGCKGNGTFDVVFNPLPIPKILKGKTKFCVGEVSFLDADKDYANIEWFETSKDTIISKSKRIETSKSGNYYYKASNIWGCFAYSDSVKIRVNIGTNMYSLNISADNIVKFDTTLGNQVTCKKLTIKNKSSLNLNLDSIYLFRRLAFSIPQSQLPLFIAPFDSIKLDICFSPNKIGKDYDTLMFVDNCSDYFIYLDGTGKGDKLSSQSKCKIPWNLQIINLGKNPLNYFSNPFPNPSSNLIYMDFVNYNVSENDKVDLPIIYDIFGQEIQIAKLNGEIYEIIEDFKLTNGQILFNINEISSGLYFIKYKENDEIKIVPITITK